MKVLPLDAVLLLRDDGYPEGQLTSTVGSIMKYYLYDQSSGNWSEQAYSLPELLAIPYLDDNTVLAPEGGSTTVTLGAVKAAQTPPPVGKKVKYFTAPQGGATAAPRKKVYKVLSQKDKWFSGKFDPALLEQALNDYAELGYRVVCSSTAKVPGLMGEREEIVIILERDRGA